MYFKKFPNYIQPGAKDCGPTCLQIISKYYGRQIPLQAIRDFSETTRDGSSVLGISTAAEKIGFEVLNVKINFTILSEEIPLPCILYWNKNHFVVVYEVSKNKVKISDPAFGLINYSHKEFIKNWIGNNANVHTQEGIAILLETTPDFFENKFEISDKKMNFSFLLKYLFIYKSLILQLILGLLAGSILSLILPFLFQSIIDVGLQNRDINFIYLVLIAQIMLFAGNTGIEITRSWILLHLSTRVSISFISDFFAKLMSLPLSFFDTRLTGDIMQRIHDHHRIEKLLTGSSLNTLFSIVSLVIFSVVLCLYNYKLFMLYTAGSILYLAWITIFLRKRRELDYKRFAQLSTESSKVIELINGMQDIKLKNAEIQKRWNWQFLQIKLFKLKKESVLLENWQYVGGTFIYQTKDILTSFLAAKLVLDGSMTLGMMLSVQYITGQLNGPLIQLINFIREFQDTKISMERLEEIHLKDNEENGSPDIIFPSGNKNIEIKNISFRYTGSSNFVFENLSLHIPYKKTTAIVGASGSGKTTLMKLLMKFYEPNEGKITIGNENLNRIPPKLWRQYCGVVLQEGFIFNDSIDKNIALGDDHIDKRRLMNSINIANIKSFIESLPLGYKTKIGNEGLPLSGGQKQRILIARALYKVPEFILFDEATSALDANTEKDIVANLEDFLKDRTAVIIAHRLSTVKSADNIIVLESGKVVEEGNHEELVRLKGEYYRLVRNQLELGN